MNRILIFVATVFISMGTVHAAVRDANTSVRQKSPATTQRVTTTEKAQTHRTSVLPQRTTRATTQQKNTVSRDGAPARTTTQNAKTTTRTATQSVVARAAEAPASSISDTRTGAAYEQCKSAFFACMDQFCTLKNDDYRRCSCSNRIYNLAGQRQTLQDAGEQLTVFTENLSVVGMTAAQATAMKTASAGENALTSDTSASKALLQAIMNSIRGTDGNVGGKYSDLNSVNISFDTSNAFGLTDAGQAVAQYNGQNLYSAVYPQCRAAVRADCNDTSLQRAITAYLMAIEQDCNTLETAISEKRKQMKSAIREGSAMLDLARVENRQKHNSSDIATCIADIETAILSEEVCGLGYHKCLDNGEFIDVSTGAPIAGVANFYELEKLLTFPTGVDAATQRLTQVFNNRSFVQNFEKRVKKFAKPALDKCTEQSDTAWAEYLDKAMLDIYYAQKAKVSEIRQGCFDFVSACYMNGDQSITNAMKELAGDASVIIQPNRVVLNNKLCSDYVNSCNNMFEGDIIAEYIKKRTDTDTLTACRAVVKQCFDKYGGNNYENFYYPYSGLFGGDNYETAPDWFTLYEILDSTDTSSFSITDENGKTWTVKYKSECAKQLTTIDACNTPEMIEQAFGGFDKIKATRKTSKNETYWVQDTTQGTPIYGMLTEQKDKKIIKHRNLRSTGVATEVYNQIISTLTTQCANVQGRFVEYQFILSGVYKSDNFCISNFNNGIYSSLVDPFKIGAGEDMCPRDYGLNVATQSWGACLCWENGGRRSKWGKSAKCVAELPTNAEMNDNVCEFDDDGKITGLNAPKADTPVDNWCTVPTTYRDSKNRICLDPDCSDLDNLPEGIN